MTAAEYLRATVQTIETPINVPPWILHGVWQEGTTLYRVLRLNDEELENAWHRFPVDLLKTTKSAIVASNQDAICQSSDFVSLLARGVVVVDLLQYSDGTKFTTGRTDEQVCRQLRGSVDYSGPEQVSATLGEDLRAFVGRVNLPANLGTIVWKDMQVSGRTLSRIFVVMIEATLRELRLQGDAGHQVRDSWSRTICQRGTFSRHLLNGAVIEDRMLDADGELVTIFVTDRAVCHRLSRNH